MFQIFSNLCKNLELYWIIKTDFFVEVFLQTSKSNKSGIGKFSLSHTHTHIYIYIYIQLIILKNLINKTIISHTLNEID